MHRPAALMIVVLSLVVASCGGDDAAAEAPDPATIDTCEGVADAMIQLLGQTLVIIDAMTAEELAALGSSDEPPAVLAGIQADGDAVVARGETLGCTEEHMASLLAARVDDLRSDTLFGQFLIESIRAGHGSSLFGE